MGSGKGDVDIYAAPVRKGKILFEVSGIDRELAEKVLISAGKKLPVKVRVVEKGEVRQFYIFSFKIYNEGYWFIYKRTSVKNSKGVGAYEEKTQARIV